MKLTLIPAYGRDYRSQKAVQADFDSGLDFRIQDISCKWDGCYANKADLLGNYEAVHIRYKRLQQVAVIQLTRK